MNAAASRITTSRAMAYLAIMRGFRSGGEDGFAEGGAGGAGVQAGGWGQGGADRRRRDQGGWRREGRSVRRPKKGTGRSWSPSAGPSLDLGRAGTGGGAARRPGATGHCSSTQARNPARVEAGARARRSSHKIRPPRMASGVAASPAAAAARCWWRAADDADQGVAGQGVGDGGHGPDGQVPPARRGRDGVHEHAGGRPRPGSAPGPAARGGRARPGRCPGRRRPSAAASGMAASRAAMAGR